MAAAKRRDPDYQLNIFPQFDEERKREVTTFLVQTTKIFTSFRYDILLDHHQDDRMIVVKILGLHVPEILLPQTGPARGRIDFTGLSGPYTVQVIKQDKSVSECQVEISGGEVLIKKKPTNPFILISGDPVETG